MFFYSRQQTLAPSSCAHSEEQSQEISSHHSFSSMTPSLNVSVCDSPCDVSHTESETSSHHPDHSFSWRECPLSSLPHKLPIESCVYQKSESLYQSPSSLSQMSVSGSLRKSWLRNQVSDDGSVMEGTISFAMSRQDLLRQQKQPDYTGLQFTTIAQVGLSFISSLTLSKFLIKTQTK